MAGQYPITHPQKRILAAELIDHSTDKYLILPAYQFVKASPDILYRAIKQVVEQCGDLNIRFQVAEDGAEVRQYRGSPDISRINMMDFSGREDERGQWLKDYTPRPFAPLWDEPLYEFTVLPGDKDTIVLARLHHAITDGTGTVLLGELINNAYKAIAQRQDYELAAGDYMSYLAVEKKYFNSADYANDREYWRNNITDTADFPEPIGKGQSLSGWYSLDLEPELTAQLNALADLLPIRVTPFKLVMAVAGIYLARRYGSPSVPVLAAYANRRGLPDGLDKTIGSLVSTLVLKMDYCPEEDFSRYIVKADKILKEALQHGCYPLDLLSEELAGKGENTAKLWNFSVVSNAKVNTEFGFEYYFLKNSPFPLVFRVNCAREDRYGLQRLLLQYYTDVFSPREIKYMAEGLRAMLQDVAGHPQKPVGKLEMLGQPEKYLLREELKGKKLTYDQNRTFVDRFRTAAALYPLNTAVVDFASRYTYEELDSRSDDLAAKLERDFGGRRRFAAVMLPRTKEFILAVVAVMKAGGAYVPVDGGYPPDRIAYMLTDSEAAVLITIKELAGKIDHFAGRILYLDELTLANGEKPQFVPRGEDLAYMIYTSGSTGRPKGVMISHGSLAALIAWRTHDHEITAASRICVHSSFSFDASVIDIFPALAQGAQLHVISEALRFDMAGFFQYLKDHKIEDCTLPTQLGMELLQAYELPLKRVTLGGEKLKKLPERRVILANGYGPTEFTVCSSYFIVDQQQEYTNIPIGKPVANTWNYVLDKALNLVPLGCAGELYLAGPQMARGYWQRNDLTEKAFINNPYATGPENKLMYRTGDLVRWNLNGELEYLGRIDDQVKLRGFRIELGEIENAMTAFAGLAAAVAMVQKDLLIAYYVAGEKIDEPALRTFLSARLPEYMVPVAFKRLKKMPLTPGGKVNKKILPPIELAARQVVAPQNKRQTEIFEIIAGVIGNRAFGITTDLFYAGMSSLAAIKITAQLGKKYGVSLSAQEVIKGKTILAIEARILQNQGREKIQYPRQESYPLTQSQLGVYFDWAKQPGTLKYNVPAVLRFPAAIDAPQLAGALAAVIDAHPYLKTHLAMLGQTLQQVRGDDKPVSLPVDSVSEEELRQVRETFVKPFNLFAGPLFRAAVYQTPQSVCLMIDVHHLIFDGGSLDILLKDLERVYNGEKVEPDTFTAYELALREAELTNSPAYRQAKAYFSQKLAACDGPTMIPADRQGDEANGNLKEQTAVIEKEEVRNFCKTVGVTPSNLFLAGVSYVAARFSGSETVLLSTLSNGRGDVNHQNIVGMLVKTLPLVLTVDSARPVVEFVRQTQDAMFETLENDSYPFTRIAEEYHFSPQIMYAYQSGVVGGCKIAGQPAVFENLDLKKPKFKLSVHIEESEQHYKIGVQYNDALYSAGIMQTLAAAVALAVERMMADPAGPTGKISLLPPEQRLAIQRFNETAEKNKIRVLPRLFEEQVRRKGEQTALIARDGVYSYARLNAAANRIANALIDKGLKREDRVAFLLPRDGRLIATMLGILKAGGAYIPIDPEYPPERINYILTDSRARFLISGREKFGAGEAPQLEVDSLLAHANEANPEVDIKPDNLSYIIYTSGSTGKPKGVMLEHKGIANYVSPTPGNRHVGALLASASTMLSVTTVSFDMFLKESFTVLMNGLTLVFASEEQANNPGQLAELFAATGADAFNATPSRLLQYLELPAFRKALAQCKVVMAGGEKYPAVLLEKLRGITQARLINTYGPTEITVSANAKELTDGLISVGRPLANVQEYIVDKDGNQLPIGVIGELWIGGEGVARGYLGKAGLTAQNFVQRREGRVYKTGDLAKWTADGEVVILGRTDSQVKLRGLRIELGEIQTAICKYPGIKSAVVVIGQIQGHEHICAYYTADTAISPEKLRDSLKKSLTKYMVPTAYKQLVSIPVTPNGKTDRKALPEPVLMARQDYVAPANEIEKNFCAIFSQVLGISAPGAEDNFFDLGGTSLLVTKVTIEAMNRGYNISYGDVFTHPTPKEMAVLLGNGPAPSEREPIGEYDYAAIDKLLQQNTLAAFRNGQKQKLGNVLLTGATGFLGIHVLKEFLASEEGLIYCFMRRKKRVSLEKRLKSMLVYYFENSYDELFGVRIFPVEGDITQAADFDRLQGLPIDTVINCAANVKHYAHTAEIEKINVGGVGRIIDFCQEKDCKLIHISTTSVAGISIDGNPPADITLDETKLYFGQDLDNKYIGSKFRAERMILQAATQGLKAKIMRVGNLMARSLDGEFQINFPTNGFINRLRAYQAIGKIAFSTLGVATEFAPIDSTAQAILKLACTPRECCVFHPYNNHFIYIGDVIQVMNKRSMNIEAVEESEFEKYFFQAMRDKEKAEALAGLIAYFNMGKGKKVVMLKAVNDYTSQVLYRTGFKWPLTTDVYLAKFISLLAGLGFFPEETADV